MSACPADPEAFSDHLDGRSPPEERRALEDHLAVCTPCRGRLEEWARVRTLVRGMVHDEGAPVELDAILDGVREEIRHPRRLRLRRPGLAAALVLLAGALAGLATWLVGRGPAEPVPSAQREEGTLRLTTDDADTEAELRRLFAGYRGSAEITRSGEPGAWILEVRYGGPADIEAESFQRELASFLQEHRARIGSIRRSRTRR